MQQTFDNMPDITSEEALTGQVTRLVELLQGQPDGPHGYRLRRIILTNFWLYGRQEFEIPHGRLFLAGENASGKSTVLTAALPLGLDGDMRPNRLDTFGGRERRIEYYVLGGADSATPFNHERRTAYIALEFEWCDPDTPPIAQEFRQRWENGDRERTRFLTIGLSIAGNANATDRIRPLRFIITDGSRLGHDLDTIYATGHKDERRAYDHLRFRQMLEGHGIICDTQAEYERQVARYLFGFSDVKDFEKLINLLLILRRPNLSTELSFSRVHDYLKMSLRKISSETTSRVIGTIERIDAIQSEIERIQEAFDATERVHRARQHLALIRAQLAGCEYIGAQLIEDTLQGRVQRLRRDLARADKDRQEAEAQTQTLQNEQYQVSGQVKALEASEGLQVAAQLAAVRERAQEAESQMQLQQQSRDAARHSTETQANHLQVLQERFLALRDESIVHLRELRSIAADEALWETVAFQLDEAIQQVQALSTSVTAIPPVPLGVTGLLGPQSEERQQWLRHLEGLHQQREQLDNKVQNARSLETTRFQELDEVRRHFQAIQDRAYTAQHQFNQVLAPFLATSSSSNDTTPSPDDTVAPTTMLDEDESQSSSVVERFATALHTYRQTIEQLEAELAERADQAQSEMNELQLLTGGKMREMEEIKALYEQKRAEPEFAPQHPERRNIARARLAEHGIAALPLYTLLDFAPGIDEQEAGRIEYMLEDAGLLDALVVSPPQVSAATDLLAAEGLSDCLLNLTMLSQDQRAVGHNGPLRFDTAILETPAAAHYSDWEAVTTRILTSLDHQQAQQPYAMSGDGSWTHGLLAGRAGLGTPRCIGKATRLRVRQRELDELERQRTTLEDELRWLTSRLADFEQQLTQLQEQQTQLRKLLPNSGLEEIAIELAQVRTTLDAARGKYQKARQQTQEIRQSYSSLLARLERESQGVAPLTSDSRRVQTALMGMVKLKNQARSVQSQLTGISTTWNEYRAASENLNRAKANETNVAQLYERVRSQALQAQAELSELQRVASLSNAEELSERLQTLRARYESLFNELDVAKQSYTRADERANNISSNLSEAESSLHEAQQEREQKQLHFRTLLTAYPVEELVTVQQADDRHAAQELLGGSLRDNELAVRKEQLETEYHDSYNGLSRTFNHEQPTLLEYGPDLDDQGHVLFLNENRSRPIELLEILGERIEMQKTLLDEQERQLFEDFLLQEIAEAIRTHILEAEEWVQQINGVLSNLPMIGEHYSLQWKAPAEYDMTKLGSHLAQHHRLLRKPAQALTPEETETLMNSFRREIESVRLRQQESPDMNFMEALEQVFDYREWFHFDVWVAQIGGQRQRLTDRVAGTRSGAEQLFALYVPLFAALGALYRSAAPGAPRLLALDEAFDKVSTANTQRILEFLVSQDFQWIMTGPQVSGTGSKIPASARYLMLHEKGSSVATATASFWSQQHNIQSE
jgi:uncharacterized protein (TIGR02680 family)